MRHWCLAEILRRFTFLAGLTTGIFLLFSQSGLVAGGITVLAALIAYVVLPREKPPPTAHSMEFMPTILGPDLISAILIVPMLLLTLAAGLQDGIPEWWMVAIFTATPILGGLFLTVIIIRNASLWLLIEGNKVIFTNWRKSFELTPDTVKEIRMHSFKLPDWVWTLLSLFGGPRGAGTALLHRGRVSQFLKLKLNSGETLTMPLNGFSGALQLLKIYPLSNDARQ